MIQIIRADARSIPLADCSVNCCVTSPPYFGLRDYGIAGQIGLEESPDAYVAQMVAVFREVRRVLRDDGTLWLNLGDSYAAGRGGTEMPAETLAGGKNGKGDETAHRGRAAQVPNTKNPNAPIAKYQPHRNAGAIGLKHKDLIGIPWRVAFALQADGWYLRSDIIWHKPNPMPESVTDRCTKAHEYIFMLAKSERYYYDAAAIREEAVLDGKPCPAGQNSGANVDHVPNGSRKQDALGKRTYTGFNERWVNRKVDGRNKRDVWTVATQPYSEAHFATFPEALIEPCILAGCPKGGTVLDPFGGSGTTGVVANKHGRNAVLLELNPKYIEIAKRRCFGDVTPTETERKNGQKLLI